MMGYVWFGRTEINYCFSRVTSTSCCLRTTHKTPGIARGLGVQTHMDREHSFQ